MIEGLIITPLRRIIDERGEVMHMLRSDADYFHKFGEIYFSVTNPGAVKAWKLHKEMILNVAVPVGTLDFVMFDARPESPTKGEFQIQRLGPDQYKLLTIPNGVWTGMKACGTQPAILANCATLIYDEHEMERLPSDTDIIPFDWNKVGL